MRTEAAKLAGLEKIPVIVRDMDDRTLQLFAVVENIQRTELSGPEAEKAVMKLAKKYESDGRQRADLANDLGIDRTRVEHLLTAFEARTALGEAASSVPSTSVEVVASLSRESPDIARQLLGADLSREDLREAVRILQDASPENRERVLARILGVHERMENYVETMHGLVAQSANRPQPSNTSRRPERAERVRRTRDEEYAESLLALEHDIELKIEAGRILQIRDARLKSNVVKLVERIVKKLSKQLEKVEEGS